MPDKLTSQFNNESLLGQASGSMIEMPGLATAHKSGDRHSGSEKAKDKRFREFIDLVGAANAYLKQLQNDIDDMECMFSQRDGDAWREKLALKILDPDEVPQQREGESIEDYRKRLEPLLINKMLNADGSIKDKYKYHPELSDYAQWAQKKYHYNIARGYVRELEDPDTSPERKEEIYQDLKQNADIETLVFAERGAAAGSDVQGVVKDAIDRTDDNLEFDRQNNFANEFMKP